MSESRSYGSGSVRQKSDGRWEARYYDADGKRRSVYGKSERDAERKLRQALNAVEQGQAPTSQRLTLATYLTDWLENVARPKVRPKTLASYRQTVNQHLIPALGNIKLARLTPTDVQRYLNEKLNSGLSRRSVSYHRAILRKSVNDAMRFGYVHRNVVTLTEAPGTDHREYTWLDADAARIFVEAAQAHRQAALWILAVTTGMRQGELLGLAWRDVDLDRAEVRVTQQLQRVDRRLQLLPLKTEQSRRTVPLAAIAVETLRGHTIRQAEEQLLAGPNWQNTMGLVFTTELGNPLEPRNVTRAFKRLLRRAGLPEMIRFHDLRHSAASMLIAHGADFRTVADVLGHSQPTLTIKTYSHLTAAHRRAAVARLDDVYGK